MASYYKYGTNLSNKEKFTSVVNTTHGTRRYFSSIDTDVYFGDTLIDEMVAFDFIIEERKLPIYGYNTFVPKRIITGQKIIQGTFAINFTKTGSMASILKNLPDSLYQTDYEEVGSYCSDDNKPLFDKGFDITLSYGDAKTSDPTYGACTQSLIGVYITSYKQAFDTSGEPILDMYTFIAKDLIVQNESSSNNTNGDIYTDNSTTKAPISSEDYIIANINVSSEVDKLYNYCKEHPNTFGLQICPEFKCLDGMPILSMFLEPYNGEELNISKIAIAITDIIVSSSNIYTINNKIDISTFHYEMQGTDVTVGKKILKLFKDGEVDSLECNVLIECSANGKSYSIDYKTILMAAEI